jgi:hypothetical protein
MTLDVLCRIVLYYEKCSSKNASNRALYQTILHKLPVNLNSAISEGLSAKDILLNMRPYLQSLNKNSPHIASLPFTSFGTECYFSPVMFKHKIQGEGWIEISRTVMSIHIPTIDTVVKFPLNEKLLALLFVSTKRMLKVN